MPYDGFTTSAYFTEAVAPVTTAPLTMACWFYLTNTAGNQALHSIQRSGSSADYFGLGVNGGAVYSYLRDTSAANINTTATGTASANTWTHAAAVFESSTNRSAFFNGGGKQSTTTSRTPTFLDCFRCGVFLGSGSPSAALIGAICEIGVWDAALSDAEVASLAKGISCFKVRPQSLIRYRPFIRDTRCLKSAATLSATGSPAVSSVSMTRIYL